LDTDVAANDPAHRGITDRLYGGDQEHRLRQELVLGVGGARALSAFGIEPVRYHLNEGHAGLLVLELLARRLAAGAPSLGAALDAGRPHTLFTTHTPVPAGIDRFPHDLFSRYVTPWALAHGVDPEELYALGAMPGDHGAPFNMAAFCLAAAGAANGVSA